MKHHPISENASWQSHLPRLALVAALALLSPEARAAPRLDLPPGTIDLAWDAAFSINGMPARIRMFDAPGTVASLASRLLASMSPAPWLMALPDGLMMTGGEPDAMWSLQLRQVARERTHGVMAIGAKPSSTIAMRPAWVPLRSTLHLDMESAEGGLRMLQQLYTDTSAAVVLEQLLHTKLSSIGWRRVANTAGVTEWRRGKGRLHLIVISHGRSSAFLYQQFDSIPKESLQ